MLCHHCGHEITIPSDPERFDDLEESVWAGNTWVKLTVNEWDMLSVLRSRMGRCVSYQLLYDAIYGSRAMDRSMVGLRVYKTKITRKLAGSGFEIKTFPGRGYGLFDERQP